MRINIPRFKKGTYDQESNEEKHKWTVAHMFAGGGAYIVGSSNRSEWSFKCSLRSPNLKHAKNG
jgi:hypothetical protein